MRTELKGELLILVPETADEVSAVAAWKEGREGHVLALLANRGKGAVVRFLGPREEVCREPINVTSKHPDPQIRLIGNFAATPFELDGVRYASVESFWQGLKFPEAERVRIAELDGAAAKRAGAEIEYGMHVRYQGAEVVVGTWAHWQLMERACRAKFTQNFEAMSALVATAERPLVHRMRKDSRTIPGAIMAEIWMRIRKAIAAQAPGAVAEEEIEA
jgi:hypothetical protein